MADMPGPGEQPTPWGFGTSYGIADQAAQHAEYERDHLALDQAAKRAAFRGGLEARFSGNPEAYLALYEQWLPVVEFEDDMHKSPLPTDDGTVPFANQSIDWD